MRTFLNDDRLLLVPEHICVLLTDLTKDQADYFEEVG